VTHTAFSVPPASIPYWEQRLATLGIRIEGKEQRFGETVLTFSDPDGMKIELVGHSESEDVRAPRFADVPVEHAIRGFFGVTMLERDIRPTEAALDLLGFRKVAEDRNRFRFSAGGDALGNHLDVVVEPKAAAGRPGAGTVHHIAFRSSDYEDQKQWLELIRRHLSVSPVMERDYFRSIYFREPGGVLFELATDNPGFAIDEPLESLGEQICIPDWLEPHTLAMTQHLPPVTLHKRNEEVPA
jgi:glyoxalase family protein